MNDYCYETNVIDEDLRDEIPYVRDKRNQIHLQGITTSERRFNSRMLERVSNVINELYDHLS